MSDTLKQGLAALASDVSNVDLHERVLRGSRRITVRNRAIGSVAAALAIAAGVVTFGLVNTDGKGTPPAGSPSPTITESPSPAPSVPPPYAGDIRNATFEVPAMPGAPPCPSGSRKFVDGRAHIANSEHGPVELVLVGAPVHANVDGVLGAEVLIGIECHEYTTAAQLIALKTTPDGGLTPLGYVLISPDSPTFEVHSFTVTESGTVSVKLLSPGVPDGGHSVLDLQTREYQYGNAQFSQVSGPARFAAPPSDPRQTDFRNCTMEIRTGAGTGFAKSTDGTGAVTIAGVTYAVEVLSASYLPGGGDEAKAVVLFELSVPGGKLFRVINVYSFSKVPADTMYVGLESGRDGILSIKSVTQNGIQSKVTVETAAGPEVRTYQETTAGTIKWERVS